MLQSNIKNKKEEKPRFRDQVANFLNRFRMVFLGIGVALLVIVAVILVATEVQKSRIEAGALAQESLEKDFSAWRTEKDEKKKADLEKKTLDSIKAITTGYGGTFAEQRSLDLEASIAYEKKEFEKAAERWTSLADRFPRSYLAPLALYNAAAAWEEKGERAKARASFERVLKTYESEYADIPMVLFSLARLQEEENQPEKAAEFYNQLLDRYSSSSWTKLARDRIIYLKSTGKLK
jgi:TolA-binding protein